MSDLCDCGCGEEVTEENRTMLVEQVRSARVCMDRHWHFVSEDHRDRWWKEVDGKPLFENPDPKDPSGGILPEDTDLSVITVLRDNGNKAGIRSEQTFGSGDEINKWWGMAPEPFEALPSLARVKKLADLPNFPGTLLAASDFLEEEK